MHPTFLVVAAFLGSLSCLPAQAGAPDCVPQTEVDVTKIDASVVLIGEVHGTQEIPRFTLGLLCSLLRSGRHVILGVEHAGEQQALLNDYIRSNGDRAARSALLQGVNWRRYSDGRGSEAMFELVDAVRRLRADGQPIGILAIDGNENIDVPMTSAVAARVAPADNATLNRIGNARMAHSVITAVAAYRPYVVVVLSGYSHTSTITSVTDNPLFMTSRPMGEIIAAEVPVFTVGIDSEGGEHSASGEAGSKRYPLEPGPLYEGGVRIDAHVHMTRLTASPAARDSLPRRQAVPQPGE